MSLLDPLKPYWVAIRTGLWLLLVGAVFLYGRGCGKDAGDRELDRLKAQHAQALAESASKLARLATEYRETEQRIGADFIQATAAHNETLRRVEAENARLVASLRAGTVRLQDRWAGCVSASAQAAAGPGTADAATDDRRRSAARIVRAADRCAADVVALQSFLTAERTP